MYFDLNAHDGALESRLEPSNDPGSAIGLLDQRTTTREPEQPPEACQTDLLDPALREVVPVPEVDPSGLSALEWAALGLHGASLGAAALTVVGMMLLGPFGFLPVLFVGPLFAAGELATWIAARGRHRGDATRSREPMHGPTDDALEVHLALPALLAALECEHDPELVARGLEQLRPLLAEHFADEECNGLFDELLALSPTANVDMRLRAFERQHACMLDDLSAVRDCRRPGELYALRRRVVLALRAHQAQEDELIQEVYGIRVSGPLPV